MPGKVIGSIPHGYPYPPTGFAEIRLKVFDATATVVMKTKKRRENVKSDQQNMSGGMSTIRGTDVDTDACYMTVTLLT